MGKLRQSFVRIGQKSIDIFYEYSFSLVSMRITTNRINENCTVASYSIPFNETVWLNFVVRFHSRTINSNLIFSFSSFFVFFTFSHWFIEAGWQGSSKNKKNDFKFHVNIGCLLCCYDFLQIKARVSLVSYFIRFFAYHLMRMRKIVNGSHLTHCAHSHAIYKRRIHSAKVWVFDCSYTIQFGKVH